jgi:tetratricopeptide (TPR) repeat protein
MIAEYREALRLDPSHSFAHEGLAIGLYRQGKLGEAILELREALGLNPDNEKAHNNLAWALAIDPRRSAREYEEAVIHARKAVEMQPADSTFQGTRALAELRAGHWAEGIASAEQSLALKKSGDSATYFVLALASWRNGDRDKAVAGFDRGVDWAQKHPPMDDDQRRLWKEAADLLGRPGPSPMGPSPARAGDAPKPR